MTSSRYAQNMEANCCTSFSHRFFGPRERPERSGSSQIMLEHEQHEKSSNADEIHRLKVINAEQEKHIEQLNKRITELNNDGQDLMERLERLQEVVYGKNARGENVMEKMEEEMNQLKKRLKRQASRLLRSKEEAKERNDRKEMSIKRLEATVADLRRQNEETNKEVSRKTWRIKRLEERVAELNQQAQGTSTMAELRQLLQERTNALSFLEAESQRNLSKATKVDDLEAKLVVLNRALQDKKARLSDLEDAQSRRSAPRTRDTEQWDVTIADLNKRLQKEMAKVSSMEEAARERENKLKALEAKVAELGRRLQRESDNPRWKGKGVERPDEGLTELNQFLQKEITRMEVAVQQKEKEAKELEGKISELNRRLRRQAEDSRRKERDREHLEAQKADTERLLQETVVKLNNLEEVVRRNSRKERDTELRAKVEELERRLQEKTETARQDSRKERENKRQIAELELRLQEKTDKLAGMEEASRQNSRKGENSERLERKVVELTAKLSHMEDDTRRWEQKNRDLSAANQKQHAEISQLNSRVKTLGEQTNKSLSQGLVRKPDSISAVEVANLVRMLNAQIEQVSSLISDSSLGSRSSGQGSAALNELRDYLGSWLFNDLYRRSNEPKTGNDPLIVQIALQTVLVHACSRIINHWNPPFWNDGSILFRVYSNMEGAGHIIAGTWSALLQVHTTSQNRIQEANVKYLSETLVKVISAVGGSLPGGKTLPSEYQEKVEDIAKRAVELRQIVSKDVTSMDLVTYTVPSDAHFDPYEMDDTEGSSEEAGTIPQGRVVCTLEMGLQYRKRVELGKQGGEQWGVTLKPKVVLSAVLGA